MQTGTITEGEQNKILEMLGEEKLKKTIAEDSKFESAELEEKSEQEIPKDGFFQPGDEIWWQSNLEKVKSNDGEWVVFESGVMVSLEELKNPSRTESEPEKENPEPEILPRAEPVPVPETLPLPPMPPLPPQPFRLSPESFKSPSEILRNEREKYARAQMDYKKKDLENRKWRIKIREGLGFGETTQDLLGKIVPKNMEDVQDTLDTAQTEYIRAKKEKMTEVFAEPITEREMNDLGLDPNLSEYDKIQAVYKARAITQAEQEWDRLQNKVLEMTPPKEKGRIRKGFEWWAKKPLVVRIGALPILIGTGIALAPIAGLAGGVTAGLAYGGVRLARGVGGIVGARTAGKSFDSIVSRKNEKIHEKNVSEYGEKINDSNFERLEIADMDNREREAILKKRQTAEKALLMVGAGAGTGILTGLGVGHLEASIGAHRHWRFFGCRRKCCSTTSLVEILGQ